jgi:hypothetical protein
MFDPPNRGQVGPDSGFDGQPNPGRHRLPVRFARVWLAGATSWVCGESQHRGPSWVVSPWRCGHDWGRLKTTIKAHNLRSWS